MTETVFYKKQGRRYVPVLYYHAEMLDAIPEGSHLIVKRAGTVSRRYNIDPAIAPMVAAGLYAEDKICNAITKASELRPSRTPITLAQQRAWTKLAKAFGDELCTLHGLSVHQVAEAGVKAMQEEATQLLAHPSVHAAYEHFLLTAKLAYEANHE